ncbi:MULTISPECIES: LytTR family DNA-binding domain-containing protein [unclassified Leuconostoc]|uniref:LytR/AlgR family response regulator transcription factor n=1 Tax=unclassified Leuconostoc TaxID=2685106 RepID=UPI00190331A3|nr:MULTISPECIES: response regulator transcription factor [unclassified Leuconostoc]MBK0040592.1 response regulator transcription factor [Leuconostoc sp. S51]MBK0051515.1 response regulator transcription factor [Leuconostoc sp. S50]
MNFYILADDPIGQQRIQHYLPASFITDSPTKLITALAADPNPKIILLDLEIKGLLHAGINTAKMIRQTDCISPIIVITTHDELSLQIFQSHISALDFIQKAQPETQFGKKLQHSVQMAYQRLNQFDLKMPVWLAIHNGVHTETFDLNTISHVSSNNGRHYINVHQSNITTQIRNTIKQISRYHDKFLQVHASFCVNQDSIQQYHRKDNVLLLTTGDLLPVSRRFKHNLSYLQP